MFKLISTSQLMPQFYFFFPSVSAIQTEKNLFLFWEWRKTRWERILGGCWCQICIVCVEKAAHHLPLLWWQLQCRRPHNELLLSTLSSLIHTKISLLHLWTFPGGFLAGVPPVATLGKTDRLVWTGQRGSFAAGPRYPPALLTPISTSPPGP